MTITALKLFEFAKNLFDAHNERCNSGNIFATDPSPTLNKNSVTILDFLTAGAWPVWHAGMMSDRKEFVNITRPDGKRGFKVQRQVYQDILKRIVDVLGTQEQISPAQLLQEATPPLHNELNIAFTVLQVKLDLEGKGFIRNIKSETYPQQTFVSFTRKGKSHFNIPDSGKPDLDSDY